MHTGSDILDADVFLRGAEILFNTATYFPDLESIDFGSGFKVSYKSGGVSTNMEDLGRQLSVRFNEFCKDFGRDLQLIFEPGKYLVSESGTFLVKVNVVKTTPSTLFAGIDSGLNHLIRPMFYDAYHHIINVSKPSGKPRIYTVVGYICETDTFGVNRSIAEIQEEDILAIQNAGAYCFSMASNYNSRFRPAEVLLHEGKAHLIRRREVFEDLLRNQVEPEIFLNMRTALTYIFLTILLGSACVEPPETIEYLESVEGRTVKTVVGNSVELPLEKIAWISLHLFWFGMLKKPPEMIRDLLRMEGSGLNKLAFILKNMPIDLVFSTNYNRTIGTVEPLATMRGMDYVGYDPKKLPELVDLVFTNDRGKTVLVSGHSNSTPSLLNLLVGEERYSQIDEDDYENIYFVYCFCPRQSRCVSFQVLTIYRSSYELIHSL